MRSHLESPFLRYEVEQKMGVYRRPCICRLSLPKSDDLHVIS